MSRVNKIIEDLKKEVEEINNIISILENKKDVKSPPLLRCVNNKGLRSGLTVNKTYLWLGEDPDGLYLIIDDFNSERSYFKDRFIEV